MQSDNRFIGTMENIYKTKSVVAVLKYIWAHNITNVTI